MSDLPAPLPPIYEVLPAPEAIFVRQPRRRYWLHALIFAAAIFTTLVVGARLEFNFLQHLPPYAADEDFLPFAWALRHPARLLLGVPFATTLLLILLTHEMGHFIAAVRYRVFATLPFFIPAPTLIGTMGAFIRIKSPIPSRRALFDVGIAGPIAGFVVAVPALMISLPHSKVVPVRPESLQLVLGEPLIFQFIAKLFHVNPPPGMDIILHPVAFAAWVGFFATALNLLPSGQLDGGHIIYSLFGG